MRAWQRIAAAALMALTVAGLAAPTASAEPNMEVAVAATCHTLDQMPTIYGVNGSVEAMLEHGFTGEEAGQVLVTAGNIACTRHKAVIQRWMETP